MRLPAGFVEAIRSSPGDDVPRLAAADWLDENGDPARAELIRVQCDLARMDVADERYPELHVRQLDLLAAHEREWLGDWFERLVRWTFDRGFVREITATPDAFAAADPLYAAEPIDAAAFVDEQGESLAPDMIRDVLSRRHAGRLRAIDAAACQPDEPAAAMFGGDIHTNAWLRELARTPAMTGLRELSLFGGTRGGRDDIDPNDWQAFCTAEHLAGLTHLDLSNIYDYHGDSAAWESALRGLAGATFAPGLRVLRFDGCHVCTDALLHLTRSRRLTTLETLTTGEAVLGSTITPLVAALLDPAALPALRDLTVPYGRHLAAVADHPGWGRFERVGLDGTDDHRVRDVEMHAAVWRTFLRSPHLRPTTFHVYSPGYYDLAVAGVWDELAAAPWFGGLTELAVSLYEQGCGPLFDRPLDGFPWFRSLSLNLSPESVERLAKWPGSAYLVELGLSCNRSATTPEAALTLAASPHLTRRLARLGLSGACRTPEAVAAVGGCPAVAGVRHLDFAHNELTADGVRTLAAGMSHLESLHLWSEWSEDDRADRMAEALADPTLFPRLRDVVIGSGGDEGPLDTLRRRFGPRLRIFSDY